MGRDDDAYAALGLEPGADAIAVERAYKALIKEHHPDRAGGNSARASEINRAYRELRAALLMKDDLSLHPSLPRRAPGWSKTIWAVALLAVLGSAALALSFFAPGDVVQLAKAVPGAGGATAKVDAMDAPLTTEAIAESVLAASRLSRTGDEMRLVSRSRSCHTRLRKSPAITLFDRCAAFDDAVVRLQDRDPLRDQGNFSEIAVTGRLFSSAAPLSGDYVATDSRMRRIRVQVAILLAPSDD